LKTEVTLWQDIKKNIEFPELFFSSNANKWWKVVLLQKWRIVASHCWETKYFFSCACVV